ncbi:MAG: hypothetical protein ACSLEZ_00200 [Thiobacillus sp.]
MIGTVHFLPPNVDPNKVLPFILDGQGTLAAAAQSAVTVASSSLLSSYVGMILAMGVTVRGTPDYEYTGNITFALNINQGPFVSNGQGSWTTQRGSVQNLMPTFIRLPLGASKVTFTATRGSTAGALAQSIAFLATGIMWPDTKPIPTDAARFRV